LILPLMMLISSRWTGTTNCGLVALAFLAAGDLGAWIRQWEGKTLMPDDREERDDVVAVAACPMSDYGVLVVAYRTPQNLGREGGRTMGVRVSAMRR
jgi:hypothetical protein